MKAPFILASLLLSVQIASATEINFSQDLLDASGKTAQDCDNINRSDPKAPYCDKYVNLTLGRLVAAAVDQTEQGLKPADIIIRGSLARKIRDAISPISPKKGKVDLDVRDIDLIKEQLAKMQIQPSTIDQAYDMLTPSKN